MLETLYTDNIEEVNQREIYWIDKMESYCGTGKGYNMDKGGGQKVKSSILSHKQLAEVKQKIKDGIAYIDIEKEYNLSASFISSINHGIYFHDEAETYPLFKYYKDDVDYDELIELLLNTWCSFTEIAKMLNIGQSTVKKINAGTLRRGLYPTYPIRKKDAREQRADKIKELLQQNMLSKDIISLVGASKETIRRINVGESFYDPTLNYPLRKNL